MTDVPSNLIPTRVTQLPLAPVADPDSLMMIVYQGNNYQIRVGDLLSVAGVPITTQVIAGTAMAGGGALSGNVTLSVANGGIGTSQLAASGVTPGTYGTATDIPVFTVDSTGRVMSATTIPATISGYVPTTRQVIAGTGLTGGGALSANVTLNANLSSSTPLAGFQSGSAGSATSISRSDHKHPAVNLALDDEVDGILGLNSGGTAKSIVAAAGAIIWSGADGLYVGPVGSSGQVLVSGGAGAPTWGSALLVVDQAANVVYAGPTAGPAAPTAFRALVNADLPASGVSANTYGSSSLIPIITINAKGVITSASTTAFGGGTVSSVDVSGGTTGLTTSGGPITTSGTITLAGTLAIASGGTGQTTASAAFNALSPVTTTGDLIIGTGANTASRLAIGSNGYVLTSNGTTASWAVAPAGGVTSVAQSFTGGLISVTGSPITSSGTLALTVAGTSGGIPYFSSASTWATSTALTQYGVVYGGGAGAAPVSTAAGTAGYALIANSAAAPTFQQVSLSAGVTGTLPVANGGTGAATLASNNVLLGNGTSALQVVAPGASGNVLTSNGTTWASTTPAAAGNYTRTSFTATAGQTTFTASYTVGYVQVFLNGVLLNSTDYTASSGTNIVLATAASLNDIVEVIALYVTFSAGSVNSGTSGQLTYYAATGTAVSGTTTGTGVVTALGVNVGSAGAFVVNGGALGTPSSGTLTSATGLPVSTGISGLGTNTATALAVNVGSAGAFVVNGGVLGTPSSGTLTNATGLPLTTGVTGLLPLANGGLAASVSPTTAGNVVFTADGTTWSSAPNIVRGTTVSASGTSIDFSSIPSWVKRVTLNFSGISTSGTSLMVVRLGTSGGIVSTGYLGASQSSSSTVATQNWTTGFGTRGASTQAAADIYSGIWFITLLDLSTNLWCSNHTMALSNTALMSYGASSVPLGSAMTTIRLTTVNGTDSFDAGSINILYE